MIEGLKPYAEYNESGLPWLGKVPRHWDVRRAKSSIVNVVDQTTSMEPNDVYVALENIESWTGRVRPQRGSNLFTGQVKRFRPNDVLFGKLRPYLAKVTRWETQGVCVGELFVLRPRNGSIIPEFLELLLRAKTTIDIINSSTFGAKMPRADWQFVGNLQINFPPPDEQAAIVRFLDHANRKIDGFIRAKRKLIGLLNEQKQAIIHRAVTRGLHPDVPLKPSGIPWLGDIPKHWEVKRLRHACEMRVSNVDKHTKQGETPVRLCNYVEVYKYERISETTRFMAATANQDERVRFRLRMGDVLITKDSEVWNDIGVPALVEYEAPDLVCGYHLAILRPRPGLLGSFLHRALDSRFIATQFHVEANGVTRYGLSQGAILGVSIPIPPHIEQQNIVNYLVAQLAGLTTAIARTEREIALMQEYRTRLTADLVTGKLDVREAAVMLPDHSAEINADTEIEEPNGAELSEV